ncbi:MAG: pilus assembly protein PilM [Planctomycetales bacterium]|nr:pilus assembly protein PilM [Planctomycetales bacterium]
MPDTSIKPTLIETSVCVHCSHMNHSHARFCGRCGKRMWEPCLKCQHKNPANLVYCGDCGTNLRELIQHQVVEYQNQIAKAEDLRQTGKYSFAVSLLDGIQDLGHSELTALAEQAKALVHEYNAERIAKTDEADRLLQLAEDADAAGEPEKAFRLVDSIVVGLRTAAMAELHQRLKQTCDEIVSLKKSIKTALKSSAAEEILPKVERLHQLIPRDKQVAELLARLQQRSVASATKSAVDLVRKAQAAFEQGDIDQALAFVDQISDEVDASKITDFSQRIREIHWGQQQLKLSPFVCPDHIQIAQRIHKLGFRSTVFTKVVQELPKRISAVPPGTLAPWSRMPNPTHLGLPLQTWHPIGFEIAVENIPPWHECLTAVGLALQGIASAQFPIDLTPRETDLFGKFGLTLGRRTNITSAWGLSVDRRGLIAVLLNRPKPRDPIRLSEVVRIDHDAKLQTSDDEAVFRNGVSQSVRQFAESMSSDCKQVVLGFAASRTLGRCFQIPKLKSKRKTSDAIQFEVKAQIPLPIDEIAYDCFQSPNQEETHLHVSLFAAKRIHLTNALERLSESGLTPVGLVPECVAMANALVFEHNCLTKDNGKQQADGQRVQSNPLNLSVVDVGVESTTMVSVNDQSFRFRTHPIGTERFAKTLASRFKLDRQQAEVLRQNPSRARWMHQADHELIHCFSNLTSEIQRAIATHRNDHFEPKRIVVSGRGVTQFGLLRYFATGK